MHGAERVFPILPHCFERTARSSRASKAMDQVSRVINASSDAESEDDFTLLPVGQLEWNVNRAAGIETGPHFSRQPQPGHRSRTAKRAVAPDKLSPVATDGSSRLVHVKEGNPI